MAPKFFKTPEQFRLWLEKNHDKETEIWVGFFKKSSGKIGMNYDQALDEVLCFGWIDGIVKGIDGESYMQRYTPRRSKSIWSKINVGHIERLIKAGKMMPAGLAVVEAAKQDGRWEAAYDSPSSSVIPEDFLKELGKNKKAQEFFKTLNKSNLYAISFRLQNTKKAEIRERKIQEMIEVLSEGKKFH